MNNAAGLNDIEKRVARCFSNVFPDILPEEIPGASSTSLAAWDSLGHVRLLSSVEEEFSVQWEIEDFDDLVSYRLIVAQLEKKFPNG